MAPLENNNSNKYNTESQQNNNLEYKSYKEFKQDEQKCKTGKIVVIIVLVVAIILGITALFLLKTDSSIKPKGISQSQEIENNSEGRYKDFPYFHKQGERVVIDAVVSEFVMQHPISGKNQIYFDTPKFGQIAAINSKNLKVCPGLMRVEGRIDSIDLDPTDTVVGKSSYEGYVMYLDNITCIENFMDPEDWYKLRVENGRLKGYIINPFPETIKFKVDFWEILEDDYQLDPYQKMELDTELDCDDFSFGVDDAGEASFSGNLIPGGSWNSAYYIFWQKPVVRFTPKECPTSPKIIMESYVEPENIKLGESFRVIARIKNSGYSPANNIEFSMSYNKDEIISKQLDVREFRETINLGFGEEKEYIYDFETIKAGNNGVHFSMTHDSLKRPWTSYDYAVTSNPLIQYDINVEAEEKIFIDGKAEFNINFTNTGIPEYYVFSLRGNRYCDFIFDAVSVPAAPWIRQKNFEQNESVNIKIIIYEEKLQKANVESKDYLVSLGISPQNDESKSWSTYLKTER